MALVNRKVISDDEAAAVLLERRSAREKFSEFAKYMVPHEPPAAHHILLCNLLDKVISGEIRRLMVFMPPGMAKSSYSSVRFPAYYLGRNPNKSIICASYGEGLASGFGRNVRNMVSSREYSHLFETRLSEDSRAKGEWETKDGGSYFAAGVGSGITGRRADCLAGNTIVTTSDGDKRIDEIDVASKTCYIMSYDKKPVYARVLATFSRTTEEIIRIHTQSGRVVEVTENHQIYTQSGYSKAGNIAEGSVLLSLVPETVCVDSLRLPEKTKEKHGDFLLNFLFGLSLEQLQWKPAEKVQGMQNTASCKNSVKLLHENMQESVLQGAWRKAQEIKRHCLWILQYNVQTTFSFNTILFNGLQKWVTCPIDDGKKQPMLAKWHESFARTTTFSENLQDNQTQDNQKGFWSVRSLQRKRQITRTSYQFKPIRQSLEKLGYFMLSLPSRITRKGEVKAKSDIVVMVERIHKSIKVYDLQVEGTKCFFANGVLVHNCGIIDDPVKGQKDADSELVRNESWNWYKSDFFTRLKPYASQVIVQTRWNSDDLSGRILPDSWNGESGEFIGFDGQPWLVVCLPAQAQENDFLGRKKGEWLWTDFYTEEMWEEIKKVQTSDGKNFRVWNSLYQQNPQPDSGTFFKREWFNRFDLGEQPDLAMYAASDYAVTDKGGDFTEHGVGGFDKDDNLYFTDWYSEQATPDVWIEQQIRLAKKHQPYVWLAEVGVIRRSVEPFLNKAKKTQRCYFRQEWMPHIGDKAANAKGFQWLASCGQVYIPRTEWGDALLDQLVKFIPNTNFKDDKVDVCGLFGRILDQVFAPMEMRIEDEIEKDSYGFDEEYVSSWKIQ